jgi:hypothetical protein
MEVVMSITDNECIVAAARVVVAWPNRFKGLDFLSGPLMRLLARAAMRRASTQPADDLDALFEEWRRAAPALADYRLTRIQDETVYAEIHTRCALRGSGEVAACHRMMEYDREVMRVAGGELVILSSQAASGLPSCTVALRMAGASMSEFTPAHQAGVVGR